MAENINALLARGVGPAMVEGAQAGYYSSRTRHEDEQERRRLAVQPDIPLALKGDMDAYGRVAGADPKAGLLVATEMQRIEDAKRKRHADAVAWSADAADAILKAAPAERPALWKTLYQQGVSLGHDMSQTPPDWSPGLEPHMRTIREQAVPYLERWKAQKQLELKKTPPGKNAPAGAGAFDKPSWGGPAPNIPVEPAAAPDQSSALPDNGPVVASAEPPAVATGQATAQPDTQAAPVQTAQAAPTAPPGWQAMGHRDPQGNLVPALMDGKPVYRNVQTGELTSQPPVQQAAAPSEGVPELSSGGTGPQGPGGALPPGVQMAQAGPPNRAAPVPAAPGAVVHEIPPGYEPVRQQGIPFVTKQGYIPLISQNGPPILLKPADQKPVAPNERPLPPVGYTWGPGGGLNPIPGGPADPAVIERTANARKTAAEKAIPQTITKGMQENLDALKQLDRVETALKAVPESVGGPGSMLAATVPGAGLIQNRIDKEGTQLRALVADIGSMKIHDRSGAAVTVSEFPRLRPFIPSIADDAATIRSKLANFRAVYVESLADATNYFGPDNGYKAYTPAIDYLEGKTKGTLGTPPTPEKPTRPPLGTFQR